MAAGISTPRANSFLDSEYGTVYVQLHTGNPGASGTANVSVGDSSRKQATMSAASGGTKAMSSMSGVWTNGGTSETITYLSFWTAASSGSFLRSSQVTTSKAWASSDTISLDSWSVSVSQLAS